MNYLTCELFSGLRSQNDTVSIGDLLRLTFKCEELFMSKLCFFIWGLYLSSTLKVGVPPLESEYREGSKGLLFDKFSIC